MTIISRYNKMLSLSIALLTAQLTHAQGTWTSQSLHPVGAYSSEVHWGQLGLQLGGVSFEPAGSLLPCQWEDSALSNYLISKKPGIAKAYSDFGPAGGSFVGGELHAGYWAWDGTGYQFVDLNPTGAPSSLINTAMGTLMGGRANNGVLNRAATWVKGEYSDPFPIGQRASEINSVTFDPAGFGTIYTGIYDNGNFSLASLWFAENGKPTLRGFSAPSPFRGAGANGTWYYHEGILPDYPIQMAGFGEFFNARQRHGAILYRVNSEITRGFYSDLHRTLPPTVEESEAITGTRDFILGKYRNIGDEVTKSCLWGLGQVIFLDDYLPPDYIGSEFRAIVADEFDNLAIYGVGYKLKSSGIVPEALALYYTP